jgi:two-component system, NtrC family, sensor kinase
MSHPALRTMEQNLPIHHERMYLLGTLTAGIAHELNNPIGYISSNLGTLKRYVIAMQRLLDDSQQFIAPEHRNAWDNKLLHEKWSVIRADLSDVIEETLHGTEHVKHIVADLKTLSRSSANAEYTLFDSCVLSSLSVLSHLLRQRCTITHALQAGQDMLLMKSHIMQLIINLVHNACDSVPTNGGKIHLATRQENDATILTVEDNGPGVPVSEREKIFTPFVTSKAHGTGLGLALALQFAEEHQGTITCDDSPLFGGARFTVTLRGIAAATTAPMAPTAPAAPKL